MPLLLTAPVILCGFASLSPVFDQSSRRSLLGKSKTTASEVGLVGSVCQKMSVQFDTFLRCAWKTCGLSKNHRT